MKPLILRNFKAIEFDLVFDNFFANPFAFTKDKELFHSNDFDSNIKQILDKKSNFLA